MENVFWQEWKKIEDWLVGNGYCEQHGTLTGDGRDMLKNIPTACTDWVELYRYYDTGTYFPDGRRSSSKFIAIWMPHRFRDGRYDWWEYRYSEPAGDLTPEDLEKYRELFGIPREGRFDPLDEMDIL